MTNKQCKCARNMLHILYGNFPTFYRRFSLLEVIEFNTQLGSLKNLAALRKSLTDDQKSIVALASNTAKTMGRFAPSTLVVGSACLFLDEQNYLTVF